MAIAMMATIGLALAQSQGFLIGVYRPRKDPFMGLLPLYPNVSYSHFENIVNRSIPLIYQNIKGFHDSNIHSELLKPSLMSVFSRYHVTSPSWKSCYLTCHYLSISMQAHGCGELMHKCQMSIFTSRKPQPAHKGSRTILTAHLRKRS